MNKSDGSKTYRSRNGTMDDDSMSRVFMMVAEAKRSCVINTSDIMISGSRDRLFMGGYASDGRVS
jgi:hypothetical protein